MKAFILALFLGLLLAAEAPATCTAPAWDKNVFPPPLMQVKHYFSATVGKTAAYGLYLPAAYTANPTQRFPVLYWLHGGGGSLTSGRDFVTRLDSAINRGVVAPFIVVFGHGPDMMWTDSKPGSTPFDAPIESVIINDLIPLIDSTYRTIATRAGRGIEGFSMGGRGSTRLGFKYPELFSLVSNLAGAVHPIEHWRDTPRGGDNYPCIWGSDEVYFHATSPQTHAFENQAAIIANGTIIRTIVGDLDRGSYPESLDFVDYLDSLAIPNDLTVVPGIRHCYTCMYDVIGDPAMAWFNPWVNGD